MAEPNELWYDPNDLSRRLNLGSGNMLKKTNNDIIDMIKNGEKRLAGLYHPMDYAQENNIREKRAVYKLSPTLFEKEIKQCDMELDKCVKKRRLNTLTGPEKERIVRNIAMLRLNLYQRVMKEACKKYKLPVPTPTVYGALTYMGERGELNKDMVGYDTPLDGDIKELFHHLKIDAFDDI